MPTTAELITRGRVKVYETLEIKRRYEEGYEASWYDISTFIIKTSATKVRQVLDFESFGYGEFKDSSVSFELDNNKGVFNPPDYIYSLFVNTTTRQYTKVRYKAGYKDANNDKVDELVFEGLLSEKTIAQNIENDTVKFTALSYQNILAESTVNGGTLTPTWTPSQVVDSIMQSSYITQFITYDSAQINFARNDAFENAALYENLKISDVLTDMCKKTNSVWYVDKDSLKLIVRDRTETAAAIYAFSGGAHGSSSTNIIKIQTYDEGYKKLINVVKYNDGTTNYITSDNTQNLQKFGTNIFSLSGAQITNANNIQTLSETIRDDFKAPRKRIVLTTIYMPNVVALFDRCTVEWVPRYRDVPGKTVMIFNAGGKWNNGEIYSIYEGFELSPDRVYLYQGFEHLINAGQTKHYLIEKAGNSLI